MCLALVPSQWAAFAVKEVQMHSEFSGYGTAEVAAESVVNFCRCAGHEIRLKRTSADYYKPCQRVLSDSCSSG